MLDVKGTRMNTHVYMYMCVCMYIPMYIFVCTYVAYNLFYQIRINFLLTMNLIKMWPKVDDLLILKQNYICKHTMGLLPGTHISIHSLEYKIPCIKY